MSGNGPEWAQQEATRNYNDNSQTQKREAEDFKHYQEQQAYNAEIERRRQADDERRKQQGG